MSSRNDLVDEVLLNLAGYLTDQELLGTLSEELPSNGIWTGSVAGSVFTDAAHSGFRPGLVEIGSELVYVRQVNPETGDFGGLLRGLYGTTPTTWPEGTLVRDNPRVPRHRVVRALNDTIDDLYPRLYGVGEVQVESSPLVTAYDLPADVADVLGVAVQEPGIASAWRPSRRWRFVANAPTESATGKCVQVLDAWHGADVHVTYAKRPSAFSEVSGTDEDFTVATGLPSWCREVVTLGAAAKIAAFLDAGRVGERTAEGDLLAQVSPVGAALKLSQHLFALFSERLQSAELRLRAQTDVGTVHYTV